MTTLHVDCAECRLRDIGCSDCVISLLLGVPEGEQPMLDDGEQRALRVLADSGLMPPLRMVVGE